MPMEAQVTGPDIMVALRGDSALKPAGTTGGVPVEVERLKLTDLPGAMRAMGWDVAPKFMERWFADEPRILTDDDIKAYPWKTTPFPPDMVEDTLVTMDWALGFPQFADTYHTFRDEILERDITGALTRELRKLGWPADFPLLGMTPDGTFKTSAREMHPYHMYFKRFGSHFDDVNDFYGALGRGTICVCPAGFAEKSGDEYYFNLRGLGFYIRDVYEFVGDQFLGIWTKEKTYGKVDVVGHFVAMSDPIYAEIVEGAVTAVFNADFNKWRDLHNKGGDFIIFSDIKWVSYEKRLQLNAQPYVRPSQG